MRVPYQVLVIPSIKQSDGVYFLIGKRADQQVWQFILRRDEPSLRIEWL